MKVLICGTYESALTQKLILRLKKEGIEIYVLNNDSLDILRPREVFQDYRFPYQSESNVNVLSSISPDIVIALGAFDEGIDWDNGEIKQSVSFDAGILNLVSCSVVAQVKRFIYLSSGDIFAGNLEKRLYEETFAYPITYRQKAILQGEKLVKLTDATEDNFEIAVIRFSDIYGVSSEYAMGDICNRIIACVDSDVPFYADDTNRHQMVYVDDAIEAIYRVITEKSQRLNKAYNITSTESYTESELVEIFNKYSEIKVTLASEDEDDTYDASKLPEVDRSAKQESKSEVLDIPEELDDQEVSEDTGVIQVDEVLSGEHELKENFKQGKLVSETDLDIGYLPKYTIDEGMNLFAKQYASLQKKKKRLEDQKRKRDKRAAHKLMPYIETLLGFGIIQIIYSLTSQAAFYQQIDIYLVFSLIIAVVLGAGPTALAVLLCTFAKFSEIMLADISQITNYQNYLWVLQLFALSVLVGFLRDRYNRIMEEKQLENDYLSKEVEALTAINDGNVEVKEVFEKRLVNYRDSTSKVYEMVSQLDELEANGVLFKSAKLIASLMNSKDVALYTYENRSGFCRLTAATSDLARSKGNSIRMDDMQDILKALNEKKIYVNHARDLTKPMFAAGTYQGEQLQVIIMVWTMDLKNMNLHQSNMLSMLSKLLERSMSRAFQYMDSIRNNTYIQGTNVYTSEAFKELLDTYCYGEKEDVLTFCILKAYSKNMSRMETYKALGSGVRGTDYVGTDKDGNSYIVLTNSREEDSGFVIERLAKKDIIGVLVEKKKGNSAEECLPSIKF